MVEGVTNGFEAPGDQGVGYRARLRGTALELERRLLAPGRDRRARRDHVRGPDARPRSSSRASTSSRSAQIAAEIRAVRPPEPYKGKGIRYQRRVRAPEGREEGVVAHADASDRRASVATGASAGTSRARPSGRALVVFRSNRGHRARSSSTTSPARRLPPRAGTQLKSFKGNKVDQAVEVGRASPQRAKSAGIESARLRPGRLPVPRAREGARRRQPAKED